MAVAEQRQSGRSRHSKNGLSEDKGAARMALWGAELLCNTDGEAFAHIRPAQRGEPQETFSLGASQLAG